MQMSKIFSSVTTLVLFVLTTATACGVIEHYLGDIPAITMFVGLIFVNYGFYQFGVESHKSGGK